MKFYLLQSLSVHIQSEGRKQLGSSTNFYKMFASCNRKMFSKKAKHEEISHFLNLSLVIINEPVVRFAKNYPKIPWKFCASGRKNEEKNGAQKQSFEFSFQQFFHCKINGENYYADYQRMTQNLNKNSTTIIPKNTKHSQ